MCRLFLGGVAGEGGMALRVVILVVVEESAGRSIGLVAEAGE